MYFGPPLNGAYDMLPMNGKITHRRSKHNFNKNDFYIFEGFFKHFYFILMPC